jgi:hypothetical protein
MFLATQSQNCSYSAICCYARSSSSLSPSPLVLSANPLNPKPTQPASTVTSILSEIEAWPLVQPEATRLNPFPVDESYVELAVDVFKAQTLSSLQALKDFLTVLPSPVSIEKVLIRAVYRLAQSDPQACCWLLSEPAYLMPELDIIEFTCHLALSILNERELSADAIANLQNTTDSSLLNPQRKLDLWQEILNSAFAHADSAGDRLLIQALLSLLSS